ncbi:MAG: hypothetical protein NZ765_07615 [Anaerolineae bacterium]|nr:hypothetical protein [Anaerolineae bacterium]MDW8071486.1 hypothetical protein [Anaerolineae bacterium]
MSVPGGSLSGWVAQQLMRRRLVAPAIAFVYAHKPLGFVGAQLLLLLQPLLDLLFPRQWLEEGVALLADCEGLDALIHRLEACQAHSPTPGGITGGGEV